MMKKRFVLAAAAISLGFSALPAFAQSPPGDKPAKGGGTTVAQQDCTKLKGPAREACLKEQLPRTPGRSEDAAAREGGRTPGRSEDAAARTGVPPGQAEKSDAGAPAAGGTPKGEGGGKGAPKN
jgi:hypothetical protein